ncbi:alpha/beta hydrolase fold domain-containing protein [Spirillospora sp. CA-253888]
MSIVLLAIGLTALLLPVNAYLPRRGSLLLMASFFAAWFTIELAYHLLVVEIAALAAAAALGGLHGWPGWTGLACGLLGAAALVAIILRARTTTLTFRESGVEYDLDPEGAPRFPVSHVVNPARAFLPRRGVRAVRGVPYGVGWFRKTDVFMPRTEGRLRPGLMQIHGGGWIVGGRGEQGLPLLNHMAAQGWVGFNVGYRLSPFSVWPEHLVDLKHFVAWYREHAEEYGADPDFLCVTGGSAGGHLTAMVALTAGKPEFQPGFEDADTSVRAAVPFYGVYDFAGRETWRKPWGVNAIVERLVMQRRQEDDPEAYVQASPIAHVREGAPPFLVIHGDADSLIPVAEARTFVERLRGTAEAPVLYAEMKGGQHAFDIFPSYRTARVVEGVERYLTGLHRQYREGARPSVPDEVAESLG